MLHGSIKRDALLRFTLLTAHGDPEPSPSRFGCLYHRIITGSLDPVGSLGSKEPGASVAFHIIVVLTAQS
jgi:hypothetical protein